MKDNINKYKELTERHSEEYHKFPMYWAFGDEQYKGLLDKLKLTEKEAKSKLVNGPAGSIMFKEDVSKFKEMMNKHHKEIKDKIAEDKTGEGFIKDMFLYELNNHEYSYTRELDDTLAALGISDDDFNNNEALGKGLRLAIDEINKYEYIDDEEEGR